MVYGTVRCVNLLFEGELGRVMVYDRGIERQRGDGSG